MGMVQNYFPLVSEIATLSYFPMVSEIGATCGGR